MVGESGAAISVTFFILILPTALFLLPLLVKKFCQNEFLNLILRRICFIVAIYLMVLNSAIMMEIANTFGLSTLTGELMRYMWIFGWGGYALMMVLFVKTTADLITMLNISKKRERLE